MHPPNATTGLWQRALAPGNSRRLPVRPHLLAGQGVVKRASLTRALRALRNRISTAALPPWLGNGDGGR